MGLDHRRRGGSLENTAADRVQELLSLAIGVNDRLLVGSHLLHHHTMFGDHRAVATLGAQVEAWLDHPDASPLTRIPALWSLGLRSMYLHRFDDALRLIGAAQQVIDEYRFGFAANTIRLFEVWVLAYSGDSDAAAARLEAFTPAIASARSSEIALFHFLHAWLALSRGDPRAGLASAELAQETMTNRETAGPAINVHTALALAAAECGDLDRARQSVANARAWVDARDRGTFRTWVLMVEADVHLRAGARAKGLALLEEAFAGLRRSGSLCTVYWLRDLMNRLCAEALDAGIERETVEQLIRARELQAPSPDIAAWPWPIRIHALGRFEVAVNGKVLHHSRKAQRRVLDLLKALVALGAEGSSRDAIAAALWPESNGDAAHDAFDVTLHRLRKPSAATTPFCSRTGFCISTTGSRGRTRSPSNGSPVAQTGTMARSRSRPPSARSRSIQVRFCTRWRTQHGCCLHASGCAAAMSAWRRAPHSISSTRAAPIVRSRSTPLPSRRNRSRRRSTAG